MRYKFLFLSNICIYKILSLIKYKSFVQHELMKMVTISLKHSLYIFDHVCWLTFCIEEIQPSIDLIILEACFFVYLSINTWSFLFFIITGLVIIASNLTDIYIYVESSYGASNTIIIIIYNIFYSIEKYYIIQNWTHTNIIVLLNTYICVCGHMNFIVVDHNLKSLIVFKLKIKSP